MKATVNKTNANGQLRISNRESIINRFTISLLTELQQKKRLYRSGSLSFYFISTLQKYSALIF